MTAASWASNATACADLFCVDGYSLPRLFVVGWQKAGTTSFASQLTALGMQGPVRGWTDGGVYVAGKEPHFFDQLFRYSYGLSAYASRYPACDPSRVFFDASPGNYGEKEDPVAATVVERIARMYGPERIRRTTFVAMLDDPLTRTQSAYYYFTDRRSYVARWFAARDSKIVLGGPPVANTFADVVNRFRNVSDFHESAWPRNDVAMEVGKGFDQSRYVDFLPKMGRLWGSVVVVPSHHYYTTGASLIHKLMDHEAERSGCTPPRGNASNTTGDGEGGAPTKDPPNGYEDHPAIDDEYFSPRAVRLIREYMLPLVNATYDLVANDTRLHLLAEPPSHWLENCSWLQPEPPEDNGVARRKRRRLWHAAVRAARKEPARALLPSMLPTSGGSDHAL